MSRRDSALHASCTGGVVDLAELEDAQESYLSTITLPYCPRTRRVLATEYRGLHLGDAVSDAMNHLMQHYRHVRVRTITVRPWQRWWRQTPARQLIPSGPYSGGIE